MHYHKLYERRFTDKLLTCIHAACDLEYENVADELLVVLEKFIKKSLYNPTERRKLITSVVAAYERLWILRHKDS